MSRARHNEHKRANGGKVKADWYAGEKSETAKDAEDEKEGGDDSKYAKGGRVKHHMHAEGEKSKMRHDRPKRAAGGSIPGRKRGGGIGADKTPLSTAAKVRHVTKGETDESGDDKVF